MRICINDACSSKNCPVVDEFNFYCGRCGKRIYEKVEKSPSKKVCIKKAVLSVLEDNLRELLSR